MCFDFLPECGAGAARDVRVEQADWGGKDRTREQSSPASVARTSTLRLDDAGEETVAKVVSHRWGASAPSAVAPCSFPMVALCGKEGGGSKKTMSQGSQGHRRRSVMAASAPCVSAIQSKPVKRLESFSLSYQRGSIAGGSADGTAGIKCYTLGM